MSEHLLGAEAALRQALRNVGQSDAGSLIELAERLEAWSREVGRLFGDMQRMMAARPALAAAADPVDPSIEIDSAPMGAAELKAIRDELGCMQEKLARRIGVTADTLWRWETGGRPVSDHFTGKLRGQLAKHRLSTPTDGIAPAVAAC